ncbi:MAG: hypothetical protein II659_08220 [Bacteroidales bacterium]|nr:hypothetical protein [Bacteroidales bacterium]
MKNESKRNGMVDGKYAVKFFQTSVAIKAALIKAQDALDNGDDDMGYRLIALASHFNEMLLNMALSDDDLIRAAISTGHKVEPVKDEKLGEGIKISGGLLEELITLADKLEAELKEDKASSNDKDGGK